MQPKSKQFFEKVKLTKRVIIVNFSRSSGADACVSAICRMICIGGGEMGTGEAIARGLSDRLFRLLVVLGTNHQRSPRGHTVVWLLYGLKINL